MRPLFLLPRRFERTTLIGIWCAAVLAGIALSATPLQLHGAVWLMLGGLGVLLSVRRTRGAVIVIIISGLVIGAWRGSLEQERAQVLMSYYGHEVAVTGRVAADPDTASGRLQVRLNDLAIGGEKVTGSARVVLPIEYKISRGDTVQATGVLKEGFGSYQATLNYAKAVFIKPSYSPEIQVRDGFASAVRQAVPEPEASLGLGFLLGQRSALPADIEDSFRLLGLTHIVVASGYNLTVLVRLARRVFERVSKFQATAVSLGLVIGFVAVAGFSASMVRAALVTILAVWAWHYGRRVHPLLLIVFVAVLTALWNPFYVWTDVGWYLSFLAFAGVLLLAPLVTRRLYGEVQPSLVTQVLIETLCAQFATLPLILYLFGTLPVLSVIANLLVVPFIPLVMLLTFAAGAAALAAPMIGQVIGVPAWLLLSYVITLSEYLAAVSWASFRLPFSLVSMLVAYGMLVLVCISLWIKTKYDFLQRSFID